MHTGCVGDFKTHDCLRFAWRWANKGLLAKYDFSYRSKIQAVRALRDAGFKDLVEAMDAEFYRKDSPEAGDLVVIDSNTHVTKCAGIAVSDSEYVYMSDSGVSLGGSKIIGCWRPING